MAFAAIDVFRVKSKTACKQAYMHLCPLRIFRKLSNVAIQAFACPPGVS